MLIFMLRELYFTVLCSQLRTVFLNSLSGLDSLTPKQGTSHLASIVTLSQQLVEHLHSTAKTYILLCLYESQACCFLNSWHCIISCATFEGAYDLFVVRCTTRTLKCFTYVSFMNYSTSSIFIFPEKNALSFV